MKSEFERASSWVSERRGLTEQIEVPYIFIHSGDFHDMVDESLDLKSEAQKLQPVYVALDLMEEDLNLYEALVGMHSQPAWAFYDYEMQAIWIVSDKDNLGSLGEAFFAHEYTHSLQDQHFDLRSLTSAVEYNSDRRLALESLIEGDATRVETDYVRTELGLDNIDSLWDDVSIELSEQLSDTLPDFVIEEESFPYWAGLRFVDEFYDLKSLDAAFSDPPQSTEQILHPEKYLDPNLLDEPQDVDLPDIESALGEHWYTTYEDVLGEFRLGVYLATHLSSAQVSDAVAGWGGDRIARFSDDEGEEALVIYSTWDTIEDAQQFFDAYVLYTQYDDGGYREPVLEKKRERSWRTAESNVYLSRRARHVLIILSGDEAVLNKVVSAFAPEPS